MSTLNYIVYDQKTLDTAEAIEKFITRPLIERGFVFQPDSEIFDFQRDPNIDLDLSACIMPVNEKGEITPGASYKADRSDSIHERTRVIYLEMLSRGIDIFPIVTPTETQIKLGKKFPNRYQKKPFKRLLETYARANPYPYNLAVISTAQSYAEDTRNAFLEIAEGIARPVEIFL